MATPRGRQAVDLGGLSSSASSSLVTRRSGSSADDRDPCTQNSCVAGRCVYKPGSRPGIRQLRVRPARGRIVRERDPSEHRRVRSRARLQGTCCGAELPPQPRRRRVSQLGADRWRRVADRLVPPVAAKVAAECAQDLSGILRDAADDVVKSFDRDGGAWTVDSGEVTDRNRPSASRVGQRKTRASRSASRGAFTASVTCEVKNRGKTLVCS